MKQFLQVWISYILFCISYKPSFGLFTCSMITANETGKEPKTLVCFEKRIKHTRFRSGRIFSFPMCNNRENHLTTRFDMDFPGKVVQHHGQGPYEISNVLIQFFFQAANTWKRNSDTRKSKLRWFEQNLHANVSLACNLMPRIQISRKPRGQRAGKVKSSRIGPGYIHLEYI